MKCYWKTLSSQNCLVVPNWLMWYLNSFHFIRWTSTISSFYFLWLNQTLFYGFWVQTFKILNLGEVISEAYVLEYGTDRLEMHVGAVQPGERALVIDDLIATGGTLCAAIKLLGKDLEALLMFLLFCFVCLLVLWLTLLCLEMLLTRTCGSWSSRMCMRYRVAWG